MRRSQWQYSVKSDFEPIYFFVPGRPYHPSKEIWQYDIEDPNRQGAMRVMAKKLPAGARWTNKVRRAISAHFRERVKFPIAVDMLWCCPNRSHNQLHKLNQIPLFLLCRAGHYQLNGNLIYSSTSEIQIVTDPEEEGLHMWIEPIEHIRHEKQPT